MLQRPPLTVTLAMLKESLRISCGCPEAPPIPEVYRGKEIEPGDNRASLQKIVGWLNARDGKSLVILGNTGTGKTMALYAISVLLNLKTIIGYRYYPTVYSMAKLMHEVRKFKDDNMIKRLISEEYLLLDDLGAEYASDFTLENMFFLVDERYLKKLVNVFTSNLTIEELYRTYGDRIMGRILENSTKVVFAGPDRRRKKAG